MKIKVVTKIFSSRICLCFAWILSLLVSWVTWKSTPFNVQYSLGTLHLFIKIFIHHCICSYEASLNIYYLPRFSYPSYWFLHPLPYKSKLLWLVDVNFRRKEHRRTYWQLPDSRRLISSMVTIGLEEWWFELSS